MSGPTLSRAADGGPHKPRIGADQPFVGHAGIENSLAVVQQDDRVIYRVAAAHYWLIQAILALFGGLLSAVLWVGPGEGSARMPWPLSLLLWILNGLCWFVFLRNLAGTPRVEVLRTDGEIRLFRWRTEKPWRRIRAAEVSHFAVETQLYVHEGGHARNFVALLITNAGERVPLCASTDLPRMSSLADDLVRLTGRPRHV